MTMKTTITAAVIAACTLSACVTRSELRDVDGNAVTAKTKFGTVDGETGTVGDLLDVGGFATAKDVGDGMTALSNNLTRAISEATPVDYTNVAQMASNAAPATASAATGATNYTDSAVAKVKKETRGLLDLSVYEERVATNGEVVVAAIVPVATNSLVTSVKLDQLAAGLVPNTRTVNKKPLSEDVELTAADFGSATTNALSKEATARENADKTLRESITTVSTNLASHVETKSGNPHGVTASDVGVGLTNDTIYVDGAAITPLTEHQSLAGYATEEFVSAATNSLATAKRDKTDLAVYKRTITGNVVANVLWASTESMTGGDMTLTPWESQVDASGNGYVRFRTDFLPTPEDTTKVWSEHYAAVTLSFSAWACVAVELYYRRSYVEYDDSGMSWGRFYEWSQTLDLSDFYYDAYGNYSGDFWLDEKNTQTPEQVVFRTHFSFSTDVYKPTGAAFVTTGDGYATEKWVTDKGYLVPTNLAKAETDPVFNSWKDAHFLELGYGADTQGLRNMGPIAIGALSSSVNGTAIGYRAVVSNDWGVAVGQNSAAAAGAVVVGANCSATGRNAVSLNGKDASGEAAVAVGSKSVAAGTNAVAVGASAIATNTHAQAMTAIGNGAVVHGNNGVAIGKGAAVKGYSATSKDTRYADCTAVGSGASTKYGLSTAVGANATADGRGGVASTYGHGMATAVGYNASASGHNSTAVGYNATAACRGSATYYRFGFTTAVGTSSLATNSSSTAVGSAAKAEGSSSTAVGSAAKAEGSCSAAVGYGAKAVGDYAVAIGDAATGLPIVFDVWTNKTTTVTEVALEDGSVSNAVVEVTEIVTNSSATAVGYANAAGVHSLALGYMAYAPTEAMGLAYTPDRIYLCSSNTSSNAGSTAKSLRSYLDERVAWGSLTNEVNALTASAITPTNATFSNAVLAVGLNVDTNAVAAINELLTDGAKLPTGGVATVGGLLAALAAGLAALKKKTATIETKVDAANAALEEVA